MCTKSNYILNKHNIYRQYKLNGMAFACETLREIQTKTGICFPNLSDTARKKMNSDCFKTTHKPIFKRS